MERCQLPSHVFRSGVYTNPFGQVQVKLPGVFLHCPLSQSSMFSAHSSMSIMKIKNFLRKEKISGIEARVEFPSQQPHFIRFCVCGKQETKGRERERENPHTHYLHYF